MSISDLIATANSRFAKDRDPTQTLLIALSEIQEELRRLNLGITAPSPTTVLDTTALEAAISKLTPLPPQDLDLNPVYRSYEQTAEAIKELLGEVKTTNHRLMGVNSGGGGPSVVGISGPDGQRLLVDSDGAIAVTGTSGGSGGSSTEVAEDSPRIPGTLGPTLLAVRNDSRTDLTDADLDYSPIGVDSEGSVRARIMGQPDVNINAVSAGIFFPISPATFSDVRTLATVGFNYFSTVAVGTMTMVFSGGDYTLFSVEFISDVGTGTESPVSVRDLSTGKLATSFVKDAPGVFAYTFNPAGTNLNVNVTALNVTADPVTLTIYQSSQPSGLALDATLQDIQNHVTTHETRIDYDVRTDTLPVYTGRAPAGSITTFPFWTIEFAEYDLTNRITRVQILPGAWDDRTILPWT